MTKTIDEMREEFQALFKISVEEAIKKIHDTQEEIMIAFMAKYKLYPEEVRLCYQGTNFWVEKRIKE